MEDIYSFIKHEIGSERMVTRTHLLQKFPDQRLQAIQAFNKYYEQNVQQVDAVFTVLQEANDGYGLVSALLSADQINKNMKIKDISLYALADKNQIVDEDLFPPSFGGQAPLKVTVHEVNLSSLVQAMTVESQKVVVNKKVDGLDHKRKNDSSDLNTQVNVSKQLKSTDPVKNDSLKIINENNTIAQETINKESKAQQDSVMKKPKIILKSKQSDQSQSQNQPKEQNLLPIIEEFVIKNDPIIEEPVKEVQTKNQEVKPSEPVVSIPNKTSKPKTSSTGAGSMKLDNFFKKK
ncbi:unnamed protein product (macronuclear) [Paramecium tetraurelia]|uniref:DNA polymerase delta subunit 3 n=1 Tax=Paramecium tetraurelia TaxID=5888 RepID=A0C2T0_PARTE|nr:uncharacterized protein GSPATT00034575001 [Paramecium tetraurelia]CAK65097.1 unnamed protein product [Paramecium tetraurelia]|eukprot:XP_001432494.1 hypothetical protein (macronuclear) [Paramecium tetraurelia strain d4-2]